MIHPSPQPSNSTVPWCHLIALPRATGTRRHAIEPERQKYGLLEPLVDRPVAVGALFGHACLAGIHQFERFFNTVANRPLRLRCNGVAVFPGLFDCGLQISVVLLVRS